MKWRKPFFVLVAVVIVLAAILSFVRSSGGHPTVTNQLAKEYDANRIASPGTTKPDSAHSGWQRYENAKFGPVGFALSFPQSWKYEERLDLRRVIVSTANEDSERDGKLIVEQKTSSDYALEYGHTENEAPAQITLKNYQVTQSEAIEQLCSDNEQGKTFVRKINVLVPEKDIVYQLSYYECEEGGGGVSNSTNWQFNTVYQDMLNSFDALR